MADQIESDGAIRRPHRFRYLIDIVVLIVATLGFDAAFVALYTPKNMQSAFVFEAAVQMLLVVIAWALIRLRGETLADIGLKTPDSWWRTILIGLAIAAVVFVAMYVSEKAGFRRDLSRFKMVQGNVGLTVYGVFYAFLGTGFYEEFLFRGFLFQGLAKFFGGGR